MLPMVFENVFDEEQYLALPVPNIKLYTLYGRYDLDEGLSDHLHQNGK